MLTENIHEALRKIPSITELLNSDALDPYRDQIEEGYLTTLAREVQEQVRLEVRSGNADASDTAIERLVQRVHLLVRSQSIRVINGTGIIVHTNLGRSPVSQDTASAMSSAATNYLALEIDPVTGRRGGRGQEVADLLRLLTGCEDALIVNNNAAAVTLTLSALAAGREVIVSRGEAVEIGGGFRIPDVLRQSGAHLIEVGTTNRTYTRDYEQAIDEDTAAFMKVHASNFAILGFTSQPDVEELAELAHSRGLLMIEDAGSGCLVDPRKYGLGAEPLLQDSIAAGVDVVTASGDKLFGGPQAGLILGRREVIERIRRHPLARAVRVDKTVQAGVAATLRHYLRGDYEEQVPIWWSMARSVDWLEARISRWRAATGDAVSDIITTKAAVGGGALPGQTLPSRAMTIELAGVSPDEVARQLRTGEPSVFPRIIDDRVAIDARTVLPDQDADLVSAIRRIVAQYQFTS